DAPVSSRSFTAYSWINSPQRYIEGKDGYAQLYRKNFAFYLNDGTPVIRISGGEKGRVLKEDYTEYTHRQELADKQPAQISIGGNLVVSGENWINRNSHIIVGQAILGDGQGLIDNQETKGIQRIERQGQGNVNTYHRGGKWHTGRKSIRFDGSVGFAGGWLPPTTYCSALTSPWSANTTAPRIVQGMYRMWPIPATYLSVCPTAACTTSVPTVPAGW
ncbi:TPA: hypothetical protein WLF76_002186, partial [Neisseria gonorrhoeae]